VNKLQTSDLILSDRKAGVTKGCIGIGENQKESTTTNESKKRLLEGQVL
jgi:hypothetical protein